MKNRIIPKNKYFFIFFLFLLMPVAGRAQWNAFVVNFKKELFGRGTQTWQIRAYDEDRIYFANKNGVLQYNGHDWQLYPLDNRLEVRSVYVAHEQNRVYVGGEGEFGYFEPDQKGNLAYTKLSNVFNDTYSFRGGYWGIYEIDRILYYVSDKFVVKQVGDEFVPIESNSKIDCSAVVNGTLYVGTAEGVHMLVGKEWLPVPGGEGLRRKTVRAIIPYKKGFLVATAFDGLFYGEGKKISPFVTGAEAFMQQNEIFSLAASGPYLAIGTIHKGLLLLNEDKGSRFYYNEQTGLQNNTVLSLGFDKQNNLWLGLDNGIDYISLRTAFTNLYTYPYSKGAGYDALVRGDRLYLGTNRGLFYTSWPVIFGENAPDIALVPELSGQVWGLQEVGEELFCLHDKGLYLIRGTRIERIPGIRGAVSCAFSSAEPDKCWIGTYDGLFLLRRELGKWQSVQRVEGLSEWMKNMAFESPEVLWVRNIETGMIRFELDTARVEVKNRRTYNRKHGFASIEELYVHTISDQVYFSSDSGFYRYDAPADRIVPADELNICFPEGRAYLAMAMGKKGLYALSPDMVQVADMQAHSVDHRIFPINRSQIDFIKYYGNMRIVNDSVVILPNEYGFALLHTGSPSNMREEKLFLKNVFISYPKDSLLYADNYLYAPVKPEIGNAYNAVRFEYALRSFGQGSGVPFRYRLLPDKVWSEPTFATVKEYSNLKEGKYVFEVEALLPGGDTSFASYSFAVSPPWYRSGYAWGAYGILLMIGIRLLYSLEERRIARKRKAELAAKEKEMLLKEQELIKENLRKEQEIVELKNERLEQELRHKGQEMANLMINFSRKNEILMSIKQELYKVIAEMKGESFSKTKRMLLTLNGRIDLNIESDDALKRFEEQFDLVHNNFIRRLSEKHPDLSVSERTMCAYLKMNLTSKEMAPLLNLSLRGVETLRYRLRKKLDLEREESLTDYLKTFA